MKSKPVILIVTVILSLILFSESPTRLENSSTLRQAEAILLSVSDKTLHLDSWLSLPKGLLCLPLVLADDQLTEKIISTTVGCVFLIFLLFGFFRILELFGLDHKYTLAVAALLVLTTPLIYYFRFINHYLLESVLITWSYYHWLRLVNPGDPSFVRSARLVGVFVGFLALLDVSFLSVFVVLLLGIYRYLPGDRLYRNFILKLILTGSAVPLIFLLVLFFLALNDFSFKTFSLLSVLGTFISGVYVLLLSPGRGFVWYAPGILLAFNSFRYLNEYLPRRLNEITLLIIVPGFFKLVQSQEGQIFWSAPEFLFTIPLFYLLIVFADFSKPFARILMLIASLLGLIINLSAVFISPKLWLLMKAQFISKDPTIESYLSVYVPEYSLPWFYTVKFFQNFGITFPKGLLSSQLPAGSLSGLQAQFPWDLFIVRLSFWTMPVLLMLLVYLVYLFWKRQVKV